MLKSLNPGKIIDDTQRQKNINYLKVIKLHIGGYGLEMFEMELGKDGKDR
jgi:hypothetical protein